MSDRWVPATPQEQSAMDVLAGVRAFSDAMERMHSGMKGDMDMNATDVAALRLMIMREQQGRAVSPHEVAKHLRISTASTTKLLDRLTASGHLRRQPHPLDRRARIVVLTDEARTAFYRHFGARLGAMRGVVMQYDEQELDVIARFLSEMGTAMDPDV
ncbi:MarR family winged helix-turn-helix transcriptional regulator [Microbacterium fluvii]|uniref:MarR family winged helix-turn-helix transcriptional regulator n=1 Tax=Microbacterium fluvii TaxID=415215 RepID=A0ABW2HBD5_9MICO|nr:MarR family transcriptional regulator [Microbacterium fluvii]MCU4672222.1 MarR family transcriptional regulator [Microbacterium fluvii]